MHLIMTLSMYSAGSRLHRPFVLIPASNSYRFGTRLEKLPVDSMYSAYTHRRWLQDLVTSNLQQCLSLVQRHTTGACGKQT